ncbi:hypothetical protein E3U43_017281 [Larimichthys crocea]|uniref:Uncharacterized protein n=1 Tax=Larimichthys crocea TaxID=215358 RepID=A0ACD3R0T2_LARCR|nr:hypothetical protein E3U43_017281 [Larimichthys crocea]
MRFRLLKKNLLALLGVSFVVVTLLFSTRVLLLSDNDTSGHNNDNNIISVRGHSGEMVKFNFGSAARIDSVCLQCQLQTVCAQCEQVSRRASTGAGCAGPQQA